MLLLNFSFFSFSYFIASAQNTIFCSIVFLVLKLLSEVELEPETFPKKRELKKPPVKSPKKSPLGRRLAHEPDKNFINAVTNL